MPENVRIIKNPHRKNKGKNKPLLVALWILAMLILIGLVYYVALPPLNIHSGSFWTFVFFLLALVLAEFSRRYFMYHEKKYEDQLAEDTEESSEE